MSARDRLRIAIQKSGRLADKSLILMNKCGISLEVRAKDKLLSRSKTFPLDVMHVRDDDIPEYVRDGVCDLGIVGYNTIRETVGMGDRAVLRQLRFGRCDLALAVPEACDYSGPNWFKGKKIATSYPNTLKQYLQEKQVAAEITELAGSVEIAPALGVADGICDLVSTGMTLSSNGLKRVETVLESQAVLIESEHPRPAAQTEALASLLRRVDGVLAAEQSKYIMMHAPKDALKEIQQMLPGLESPSILPLGDDKVAIHAVAKEEVFWETMEDLKRLGASSILIVPIEKMID